MVRRVRQIKGYQPSYTALLTRVADDVVKAKMMASENPDTVFTYAEALDSLFMILPKEAKTEVRKLMRRISNGEYQLISELARAVFRECKEKVEAEAPKAYWYDKERLCMSELKTDLDRLFDYMFTLADSVGLWLVVGEVEVGGEVPG